MKTKILLAALLSLLPPGLLYAGGSLGLVKAVKKQVSSMDEKVTEYRAEQAALSALTASFSFSPAGPAAGQTVSFTDSSRNGAESWYWDFGDGTVSSLRNPSHAYATSGVYTVTLTVAGRLGVSSVSRNVPVGFPSAAFSPYPEAPSTGHTVSFVDGSSNSPSAWSWSFGDGTASSLQSPDHAYASPGTYTVSLTVTNAAGSATTTRSLTVASPPFNITQAISETAQTTTLAFSGLAMMTGNLGAQSFYPPGKVADYTGFQFMRDNDPDEMGHNTSFLTRAACNVIYMLTDEQFAKLKTLATAQISQINEYGYKRFPLMKAFRRLMDGDIPAGADGLSLTAVKAASRALYLIDGQISFDRALVYSEILNSMSLSQKAYLNGMKGRGWGSWPAIDTNTAAVRARMQSLPPDANVAVMTYAGDLLSWYAGSVEADTYFCPERQGTYYGGFYMKDAPAIGHEGYSIDTQLTATAGSAISDSSKGYVTAAQAALSNTLADIQRDNMYAGGDNSIVGVRGRISARLRALLEAGVSTSAVYADVMSMSGTYGDLDGENNYHYATVFARLYGTLSAAQKTSFMALRRSIMAGTYSDGKTFDFTVCVSTYLFSSPVTSADIAPYVSDTDYLFGHVDPPAAAFTASAAQVSVGQSVAFTDASLAYPTSWYWTFGDGAASSEPDPSHAYSSSGTYTVTLTAGNAGGSTTASRTITVTAVSSMTLTVAAAAAGAELPLEYTCDGAGNSPALSWTGAPAGTQKLALLMTTNAMDGVKWNWVLYNIPAGTASLAKNTSGVGTGGVNDVGTTVYNPPCPNGPGAKTYTFTVYALSAAPSVTPPVGGAALTSAISGITLSSAAVSVNFTRYP